MAITVAELAERLKRGSEAIPAWIQARGAEMAVKAEAGAKLNATVNPRVRSGRLRNSIRGTVRADQKNLDVLLRAGGGVPGAADVVYAGIQERGGRIVPTNARYLAIPLAPAKTAAGVSRYASPRDVSGLFFIQAKSGAKLLVKKAGAGIEPWFALVDEVTVRATWFARRAMDKVRADAPELLKPMLSDVLEVP